MRKLSSKKLVWVLVLLMAGFLFNLATTSVKAATQNYSYTDNSYSEIDGPGPSANGATPATVKYVRKAGSSTKYDSNGSVSYAGIQGARPIVCSPAEVVTNSKNALTGKLVCVGTAIGTIGPVTILPPPQSSTATGQWIDHNQISVNGTIYQDSNTDNNLCYGVQSSLAGDCSSVSPDSSATTTSACAQYNYIFNFPNSSGNNPQNAKSTAKIVTFTASPVGTPGCAQTEANITFSNPSNFNDYFVWTDSSTIASADGTTMEFAQSSTGDFYDDGSFSSGNKSCQSSITVDSSNPGTGLLTIRNDSSSSPFGSGWPQSLQADLNQPAPGQSCFSSGPQRISIADPVGGDGKVASTEAAGSSRNQGAGNGNSATGSQTLCETTVNNPLTWIMCPIIDTMVSIINAVDSLITNQLNIKTDAIFCNDTGTCKAYLTAWQSFRDIALGLMAIAGLVVLISQALGMEILDAYTIRKILPRLLVAAIGITLSWSLMRFAVQLSDDLGFGVRELLLSPFSTLNSGINLSIVNGGGIATFFAGLGGIAAGTVAAIPVWIALGGGGVLLSYVATAALAVFIAIMVLILRQIAIIVLILIAPLAIVCYILPNTHRIYKIWWESFSRALLMFPMIVAFITAGRIFSAVSFNNGGALNQLIGLIAYFAPYFLIPITYRFAGGALRQIGGFVNDRSRGGFDRLRKYRADTSAKRITAARGRGLYRDEFGQFGKKGRSVGKMLNKVGFYSLDLDEQAKSDIGSGTGIGRVTGPVGKKLLGRTASVMAQEKAIARNQHIAKALEKTPVHYTAAWAGMGMLDDKHAGQGLTDQGRKAIDDAFGIKDANGNVTGWRAPRNFGETKKLGEILRAEGNTLAGSNAALAGQHLTDAVAGKLNSFALDPETSRADMQSVLALSAAKDGKLNAADLATKRNNMMATAEKNGPVAVAFAQAELGQLESAATQQRQDLRTGKGIKYDENGQAYSVWSKEKDVTEANGRTVKAFQSAGAKDALMTAKAGQIGMGKGEYYDETGESYKYFGSEQARDANGQLLYDEGDIITGANGQPAVGPDGNPLRGPRKPRLSADAIELRKTLAVQAGIYGGGDPGAKTRLEKIMADMGMTQAERVGYMREYTPPEAMGMGGEPTPPPGAGGAAAGPH